MNNVHFIGLSSYTAPKITQEHNREWVTYETDSGESYFQYLIDNYNGSPTNNAVINGIVGQIYGSGLDAEDKTRKPDQWAELKVLISSDCLRNTITDRKITGQAAMMVTYEAGKQRIKKVSHFPVNTLEQKKPIKMVILRDITTIMIGIMLNLAINLRDFLLLVMVLKGMY